MKKYKLLILIITLSLTFSCASLNNAVNSVTDKNPVKSKSKPADIPKDIQHATADPHAAEEKAIIVTLPSGTDIYVGNEQYSREELGYTVKNLLDKAPGERGLIYVNASSNLKYGDFISALDILRREKIEDIRLLVSPAAKTGTPFSALKIKMAPEPTDDAVFEEPSPLTLVVSIDNKGKIKLNKEEVKAEEIKDKIAQILKQREADGIFRKGTNDIEKTVTIKSAKSNNYAAVVRSIDSVTGAGAAPVFVQLDDLEL